MRTVVGRKLAMATRVLDFCRIHTVDDPTYRATLDELGERLDRAKELASQQRNGGADERSATLRRRQLRRVIQSQLLPQLARAGERVAKDRPELKGVFRSRRRNGAYQTFQTETEAVLSRAIELKDQLVPKGMPAAMFDALVRTFAEFDEVTAQVHEARGRHIGATADLAAITEQVMELVGILSGFNQFRLTDDPGLRSVWLSAISLEGPFPPTPEGTAVPPKNGETQPGAGQPPVM